MVCACHCWRSLRDTAGMNAPCPSAVARKVRRLQAHTTTAIDEHQLRLLTLTLWLTLWLTPWLTLTPWLWLALWLWLTPGAGAAKLETRSKSAINDEAPAPKSVPPEELDSVSMSFRP